MKNDYVGGVVLFVIVFSIALAELYFIKKRHAYIARRNTGQVTAGAVNVTNCPLLNNIAAALNRLFNKALGSTVAPLPTTTPASTPAATPTPTTNVGCNPNLWQGIAQPARLQNLGCVTVTGEVVGVAPHFPSDGDLVFSLKLDSPYEHLLTAGNSADEKYAGGIWCEAICQHENVSTESWHQGDCEKGGPFPKFPVPSIGDRLSVTGIHTIDNGEGEHGQAEIHPISQMSKI